jgi:DNA-binding response OmpR family regulator
MCHIVVSLNTVSRLHAKIERDGPRYVLSDANSANGTFVNGRRIREPHLLEDDDRVGLGTETALLHFEDPDTTVQIIARLRYDREALTFFLNQKPLNLTPTQFQLLRHLYQHVGSICTRKSCAEVIWGRDYDPGLDADALDKAVSNLRRKLRKVDPEADLIETRRGVGFVLNL